MKVKKHNTTYTGLIQRCKGPNKIVIYVQKTKESACYKRILRNRNNRKLIQSNLDSRLDNNTICEGDKRLMEM